MFEVAAEYVVPMAFFLVMAAMAAGLALGYRDRKDAPRLPRGQFMVDEPPRAFIIHSIVAQIEEAESFDELRKATLALTRYVETLR